MSNLVTNRIQTKSTGVNIRDIEVQNDVFPISFFGYDVKSDVAPNEVLVKARAFIKENGTGTIYIPPTRFSTFPVFVKYIDRRFSFEVFGRRPPFEQEFRPYTEERYQIGDKVVNIAPDEEGIMGWVRVAEGTTGWRSWGELHSFYSDFEILENFPVPQKEREGQVIYMRGEIPVKEGQLATFAKKGPYICMPDSEGGWEWQYFPVSSYGVMEKLELLSTELKKTQKDLSDYSYGMSWKPAVATYEDIFTTYPNPERNWTVTVADTDIVYMYDAETDEWFPQSLNALPLASLIYDGKLSKEDYAKLLDIGSVGVSKFTTELGTPVDLSVTKEVKSRKSYRGDVIERILSEDKELPSGETGNTKEYQVIDPSRIMFRDPQEAKEFKNEFEGEGLNVSHIGIVLRYSEESYEIDLSFVQGLSSVSILAEKGNRIPSITKLVLPIEGSIELYFEGVSVESLDGDCTSAVITNIKDCTVRYSSLKSLVNTVFEMKGSNRVVIDHPWTLRANLDNSSINVEDYTTDAVSKSIELTGYGALYADKLSDNTSGVLWSVKTQLTKGVQIKSIVEIKNIGAIKAYGSIFEVKLDGVTKPVEDSGVVFKYYDDSECGEEFFTRKGVVGVYMEKDGVNAIVRVMSNPPVIHVEDLANATQDRIDNHLYIVK